MKISSLIQEDNLLLTKSIEAGACQEAFATGNKKILNKRKGGSICTQYHRTRRRIKSESFYSPVLSFFDRCSNFSDHVTFNHEIQVGDVMFSDCLANNLGSIATTYLVDKSADGCQESLQNDYINDSMREDGLYKFTENVCSLQRDNLMDFFGPGFVMKDDTHMHRDDSENSSAVTEVEYASLPGSLLSFSPCILNTEDTIDDIPNSQLLDSPESVLEDSSFNGDQQDVCHREADVDSLSISHVDSVQLSEGKTICHLNTEDSEIPCNDNIFLPNHPSPSVGPQTATYSIDPPSSFTQSLMDGPDFSPDFYFAHLHVDNTVKSVSADHNPSVLNHNISHIDSVCFPDIEESEIPCNEYDNIYLPIHLSPSVRPQTATDFFDPASCFSRPQIYGPDLSSEFDSAHPHVGNTPKGVSMDHNPSISDPCNSDGDSDLPCIPDIEALILKLDFEYAQESWITNEVKRHKCMHSKRTINRLEQSSSQIAMSSLGAFAVFYSHHFNYYIKKTEVTIGRSTDDTEVDIDLSKESHPNMISRQQATIKMETDGAFALKNIGKGSVLVEGKEISHGQVAALASSSLIQIRGMDFMFEINDRYVRWYLDNILKKTQGKFRTFEWSVTGG